MNQELFEKHYQSDWLEMETVLDALQKGERLEQDDKGKGFPLLFRRLCKQLALARERHYSPNLVDRLNHLVIRAHQVFYRPKSASRRAIARFLRFNLPRAVRAEWRLCLLCTLLLFGSGVGMMTAITIKPDLAYAVLSIEMAHKFEEMYAEDLAGRDEGTDAQMFGFYIRNNIGIGLRTFASGLFGGLGSIFFLVVNGILLGAVSGHLTAQGLGSNFFPFVVGHGAFELPAIVLAGVAGLRLGLALIAPGSRTRRQALKHHARLALPIVYGMGLMLVIAALIEAFWSPAAASVSVKYAVGACLWLAVLLYFLLAGRGHAD